MEKSSNSSRHEEDNSCELPNVYRKLKVGPPAKRLLIYCEQELNQLVEHTLGDGPKRLQTGLHQPFEVSKA